jgi:glycosyltransferase involved in cell wall biosynthesis
MMADALDITVLIATRNEAANLGFCLDSLVPVRRVLVVDSHSTDGTPECAKERGAEVVPFAWNGVYPRKRQWALNQLDIDTRWVLLLDADESVPAGLWDEVRGVLQDANPHTAYMARKEFHFMGRRLRWGGFSHSAVFLFQTGRAAFEDLLPDTGENLDMEVHERMIVDGSIGFFRATLIHRDHKGLQAYRDRHHAYALWEAALRYAFLTTGRYGASAIVPRWRGNPQERRRFWKRLAMRIPGEACAWFVYHYVLRGGFLEGRAGLQAALIRRAYIREVRWLIHQKRRQQDRDPR